MPARTPSSEASAGSTSPSRARSRLPLVVLVLAAGTFLVGISEFMVAGILPEMAADLHVSVAHAGLLVTAFAVGMIVGSPAMAVLTLRLPRGLTLQLALVVSAMGHVLVALSTSFPIAVAARVITALATGAFWSVGTVVATQATGPAARSRALGVFIGGLTVANVVGVPLASLMGQVAGWRSPFWALAALALGAATVIGRFIPPAASGRTTSVRAELAALRSGDLWLALAAAATIIGGVLSTYTYITPLLVDRAGIPAHLLPLVLIGFGFGTLGGTTTGGRLGDRWPLSTAIVAASATVLVLLTLAAVSTSSVAAIVLVTAMGLTGFAVNPIVTVIAVKSAGSAPTLASALSTSGFNAGIAAGSWVAGQALESHLGPVGPVVVGACVTALTLVPLGVLAVREAARSG